MSFSINHLNSLNRANNTYNTTLRKISSGSAHPSAAYGAAEYAISRRMYSNIGAYEQSNVNTQNTNSALNIAAGAVGSTVEALSSLREQIINASNGTNSPSDLSTLQKTVDQTIQTINGNADTTFNGKRLLDGNTNFAVAGADGYDNVSIGNMSAQGLGLMDKNGKSTIQLTDATSLGTALEKVDNALNSALDQATSIGAAQQGLDYQSANYTTMTENVTNSVSTIDDTNIASASIALKQSDVQQQLAIFATKMDMSTRANILKLLG